MGTTITLKHSPDVSMFREVEIFNHLRGSPANLEQRLGIRGETTRDGAVPT